MDRNGETPISAIMTETPAVGTSGFNNNNNVPPQHQQHQQQQHHQNGHHHDSQAHGAHPGQDPGPGPSPDPDPKPHLPIDPAIAPSAHVPSSSSSPSHPQQQAAAIPDAFPRKRRGRPPGRPNATVREADYSDNPLVQAWNAAKVERPIPAVAVNIRDALSEQSLNHETQRALWRLPSRETIHFVQGWITGKHIAAQRPSYINALLIHSRGQDAAVSCVQCQQKRARNALGPFLTCRVLPGSFHDSCSNCKWFDNTASCSLYKGPRPNRKRKPKNQLEAPPPPQQRQQGGVPEAEMVTPAVKAESGSQVGGASGSGGPVAHGTQGATHADFAYASTNAGNTQGTDEDLDDARLAAELLPEIQRQDS
ncbi:hypothetical protein VTJ83DRAFT_6411 [Remersonia thermophila]|uniref:Uncharacterized protein n=1 Tax=Remersonia thermophila TaxID=72144 RepID=A0ABR4D647_9PEZI